LEEIGLIDVFREAEDEAIWILIEDWEDEHDLSIDWDTVYIA
jgi:quinol monooxygenase YgiN